MKYCSECGKTVSLKIPNGDSVLRYVCSNCETIHYQNPKIVTGCIPEWQGKILLCKRAIEPRYGMWTLPAGFMENEETTAEAAIRETFEEACADVELLDLYTMFNLPHVNQVYIIYRAKMTNTKFSAGHESLEVELFELSEIPWEHMAFAVIHETLRLYCRDAKQGKFKMYTGDIAIKPSNRSEYEALNMMALGA